MPGGSTDKPGTTKCLRRCTQRFHLFMVSLQDWPCMICNERPSSICFFLWLTFPGLWQTPYILLTSSEASDNCPQILGACEPGPHPWTRVPSPHPRETGLQQRWGKGTTRRLDCKSLVTLRWTRECCAELLAAGYLNTVYIVSFCLGLIDSLLTCFGFWLYTLFSKLNLQWMRSWVFFMSKSTSLAIKLEKDICGNCKVSHPGKFWQTFTVY